MRYYINKAKVLCVCLVAVLILVCSCAIVPTEITDTPKERCEESIGTTDEPIEETVPKSDTATQDAVTSEIEPPETVPMVVTEAETADISDETESIPAAVEQTPEATTPTETEPPEPPTMPDDLHTNITDPRAAFILMEIYEAISASTNAGVYFTDVDEEYWFGIGEENKYHTASTVKPVYCQYLLSAGVDLETEITLQQVSRTSSTGKLNWDDIGTTFTVGELIEYSIRYSDNQAHRLLYETFGIEGYNKYVANFGSGGLPMDEEYEWSRVTPKKLSRVMLEIHRYSAENSILIDHLKNTAFNSQIPAGTKYETAHKYGSNCGTDGYHDTAIVYAPERAYVLTIMTHIDTAQTEDEDAVFRRVAELCDALHEILFLN